MVTTTKARDETQPDENIFEETKTGSRNEKINNRDRNDTCITNLQV